MNPTKYLQQSQAVQHDFLGKPRLKLKTCCQIFLENLSFRKESSTRKRQWEEVNGSPHVRNSFVSKIALNKYKYLPGLREWTLTYFFWYLFLEVVHHSVAFKMWNWKVFVLHAFLDILEAYLSDSFWTSGNCSFRSPNDYDPLILWALL